jgi:uncharacterized membrane protein
MASSSPLYRSDLEPRAFPTHARHFDRFWTGFATGALFGVAGAVAAYMISGAIRGGRDSRVVRFETSLQIGRPVNEVFRAWTDYERLADFVECIEEVNVGANTSRWRVRVDGKEFQWQAETVQFIPNESIGWKSISGPKHSGRITFAPIGNDTLMHVSINYAPPLGRLGGILSPITEHIEGHIQHSLRDFKAAVESGQATRDRGPHQAEWRVDAEQRSTGTYGRGKAGGEKKDERAGSIEYTRPPEARYPISNPKISKD